MRRSETDFAPKAAGFAEKRHIGAQALLIMQKTGASLHGLFSTRQGHMSPPMEKPHARQRSAAKRLAAGTKAQARRRQACFFANGKHKPEHRSLCSDASAAIKRR